ncbi:MAG: arginine deiminase family protein [Pseudomonadota bacterium]
MNSYGAQDMVSALARVMMHEPGAAMANADPDVWHYAGELDGDLLVRQHRAFAGIVESSGAEIEWLSPSADGLADAVFTHDPSLVTDEGAILLHMGKPLRRGETQAHRDYYERADVPVLGIIEAPGMVEAGDCLWLNSRTLAVGRGFRTNDAGIGQLRHLLAPLEVDVLCFDLPMYTGPDACLHLMSIISLLDHDLALIYEPLFPVGLFQVLQDLGVRMVAAPVEEFEASNGLNLNVLALAPRHGVMIAGYPGTEAALTSAGCRIETFDGAELCVKCEGGPTCLTRPVLRRV